jgi:hypothetical protein
MYSRRPTCMDVKWYSKPQGDLTILRPSDGRRENLLPWFDLGMKVASDKARHMSVAFLLPNVLDIALQSEQQINPSHIRIRRLKDLQLEPVEKISEQCVNLAVG